MYKKIIYTFLICMLLIPAGSALAQGQGGGGGTGGSSGVDRLLSALEKTDLVIDRAKRVVQESGSQRAFQVLKVAVSLQAMSKQMAEQANVGGEFDVSMGLRAGGKTLNARAKAEQAIAITRQADENEDFVRQRLEQTQEMLNRLQSGDSNTMSQNILQLMGDARSKQQRAVEFFRNGKLKASLQMTLQVQKALERIQQNIGGLNKSQQSYQNSLERYYLMRERIQESDLAGQAEVQDRLQTAQQKMEQAQLLYRAERYGAAEKDIQRAVDMLYQLAEKMRDPARVANELRNLTQKMDQIREQLNANDDGRLRTMFQKAGEHLDKASEMYKNGNYDGAVAQLQAARQIMVRMRAQLGE